MHLAITWKGEYELVVDTDREKIVFIQSYNRLFGSLREIRGEVEERIHISSLV